MGDHSTGEVWLDVLGFEGVYEVSSHGRIRRVDSGRVLRPSKTYGYEHVMLTDNARKAQPRVHVVVCSAFHGPRPSERHQAAHWDGIRDHNFATNLRWATPEENFADKARHGTIPRGSRVIGSVLTEHDIPIIRRLLEDHVPPPIVARAYGVTKEAIYALRDGATWAHVQHGRPELAAA